MSVQRNTTEKSTLHKKPEWGGALVGHDHQQHAHFLHPQQQNVHPTQPAYANNQLVGGGLDDTLLQLCAGMVFENANAQQASHFNVAAEDTVRCDDADGGAAHTRPFSVPQEGFSIVTPDASTNSSHKSTLAIPAEPRQARSLKDHAICAEKGNLSLSTSIRTPASKRTRNASVSSLTVRPTGTKDRHSKVRTAKGLRDRRVRLSAPTAIQFFDVQDRLGYDQPSKAVDWLIKKARAAIDELAPVDAVILDDETDNAPARERKLGKDHHDGSFVKVKDEEQSMAVPVVRTESRAKARKRARERAKEKNVSSCIPSAAATVEATITSVATTAVQTFGHSTSPHVHLLPEFFLLSDQLHQRLDDAHRPSNLPSMLSQPSSATFAPHHLPLSSHFFPGSTTSLTRSFVCPGDVPLSFQFSAPSIYTDNTPISPRGTLQSIFSDPANSSTQPHTHMPSNNMMMGALQQAHVYAGALNSVTEDRHDHHEEIRQRSAELGSPDLHQHSRIPMRIHGMELDSRVEEIRITPSSMQADFQ